MNKMTYLSKMMCVVAILMASNLWTNAQDAVQDNMSDDFMYLALDHYESDFVAAEELNYYRNFMTLANIDDANALTIERVANGENSFTLYRYDAYRPETLTVVAFLRLSVNDNHVMYVIEYDDANQMYHPADNITVPTQGYLADNNGIIDMNGIMFVDRFTANVSMNAHPDRYGYVLRSMDDEKSSNVIEVPVMKAAADIDGFFTEQEVIEDTDATLLTSVKNANVKMAAQPMPSIYYYTLERGNNTVPNQVISRLQRMTDGTYMEVCDYSPDYGYVYAPGIIFRPDNDVVIGEYGDYMSYLATVWTLGFDRMDYESNYVHNSYGSPIFKTGVAKFDMNVFGDVDTGARWFDEDGNRCIVFNPVINVEAEMPNYASVEYEPYMYRVWVSCNGIRNYKEDPNGYPVNDVDAPRDDFQLLAEVYDNNTSIMLGSEEGQELAFGATANSCNDHISFLVRLYYKKVTEDDGPMYYVVEKKGDWDVFYTPADNGDVNGDGAIDIMDVTILIDYLLGSYVNIDLTLADMNGDHVVDLSDLTSLIDSILMGN